METKTDPNFARFADYVLESADTRAKKLIAFVYFRSKFNGGKASLDDIQADYEITGLGKLPSDFVRRVLKKDQRVRRIGRDLWMIPSDRFRAIEIELNLSQSLPPNPVSAVQRQATKISKNPVHKEISYVDPKRLKELKKIKNPKFDLSRLMQMCIELNENAAKNNHVSTILLVRAILDHVPPIFGYGTFKEVANNFATSKSTKANLQNLENSSRNIADAHLHTPIRTKEILPTRTQVNFSPDLDVLLSEIVRIL